MTWSSRGETLVAQPLHCLQAFDAKRQTKISATYRTVAPVTGVLIPPSKVEVAKFTVQYLGAK